MKCQILSLIKTRSILTVLLTATALLGCEGGNKETSAPAAKIQSPLIQPNMGQQDTVIQTLKSRLFDDPENDALLSALGDAYFERRRFEEAITIYKKAVTINPVHYDVLNDLGLAYYYTGNTSAALKTLDKSTTANPDYKFAWLSKGFILTSEKRFEEALAPLHKAKELDPNGSIGAEADNFLRKIEEMTSK